MTPSNDKEHGLIHRSLAQVFLVASPCLPLLCIIGPPSLDQFVLVYPPCLSNTSPPPPPEHLVAEFTNITVLITCALKRDAQVLR